MKWAALHILIQSLFSEASPALVIHALPIRTFEPERRRSKVRSLRLPLIFVSGAGMLSEGRPQPFNLPEGLTGSAISVSDILLGVGLTILGFRRLRVHE